MSEHEPWRPTAPPPSEPSEFAEPSKPAEPSGTAEPAWGAGPADPNAATAGGGPARRTEPVPTAGSGDQPSPWSGAASLPYTGAVPGHDPGWGPGGPAPGEVHVQGGAGPSGYGGPGGPYATGEQHIGSGSGAGGYYPPPQGHPGQPAWSQPSGRAGRTVLAALVLLALMVIAAVGGGVVGATIYAQIGQDGARAGGGTTVVNGPQLDYTSLASIASDVSPSVVSIRVGDFGGSGVVFSEDGYIITNAHVVEPAQGDQVAVRFNDGEVSQATIVGADRRSDIAVVRAENVSGLTPARFGDSGAILVGDTVLAIGSPLGFDGSVTQGIVSALDRTLRPDEQEAITLSGLVQTDAAINRGNSGGALVNLSGEVVGVNTAIAVENQDDGFLGVGFAVPSNRATDVAEQLIAGEEISHPQLGVFLGSAAGGGALIGQVVPGSPADEAGLQPGDIVVRFGERPITDSSDLVSAVQQSAPGDTLEVEFQRDGTTRTTSVTLAEAD